MPDTRPAVLGPGTPLRDLQGPFNKEQKDARQYIQPGLAAELKAHIATKAPKAPVFSLPDETNVARMTRKDLADARRAWLQATKNPTERLRREQSDFLAAENHEGEQTDFHCLRHTCGAWLAMNGEHPNTVMRHSSITLTMDTYGHLFPGQDAEAVAKMPNILGNASDTPEALAATGTDSLLPADRQQWTGKTTRETAKPGDWNEIGSGDENSPQVEPTTRGL